MRAANRWELMEKLGQRPGSRRESRNRWAPRCLAASSLVPAGGSGNIAEGFRGDLPLGNPRLRFQPAPIHPGLHALPDLNWSNQNVGTDRMPVKPEGIRHSEIDTIYRPPHRHAVYRHPTGAVRKELNSKPVPSPTPKRRFGGHHETITRGTHFHLRHHGDPLPGREGEEASGRREPVVAQDGVGEEANSQLLPLRAGHRYRDPSLEAEAGVNDEFPRGHHAALERPVPVVVKRRSTVQPGSNPWPGIAKDPPGGEPWVGPIFQQHLARPSLTDLEPKGVPPPTTRAHVDPHRPSTRRAQDSGH